MSEPGTGATGATLTDSSAPPLTAGAMLRQARTATGLHIAALAVSLKVPVARLEALESDNLDLLPDAVFARALASSVCRVLKVDAGPILARLPRAAAPRLMRDERDNPESTFRASGETRRGVQPVRSRGSRFVVYAIIALIVGALVMIFWPQISRLSWMANYISSYTTPRGPAATTGAGAGGSGAIQVVVSAVENNVSGDVAGVSQPEVTPTETVFNPPPAVAPAAAVAPAKPVAAAASSVGSDKAINGALPSASAPLATATATTGLVAFSARGSTWVKVTDSSGAVVFQKTLNAGENATASGTTPLKVTVGRADLTDVHVAGQPFSLSGLTRGDSVARFEVK